MIPYLDFFWGNKATFRAFKAISEIALNPPNPPVGDKDQTGFENFITNNNLNKPSDLYQAYTHSVRWIENPPHPKPSA
jgi:hypothetical protein